MSSILKIATATGTATITVPVTLTRTLLMRLADELGEPTGEAIEPIVVGGDLVVSFAIEVGRVTDLTFDEIGDVAEVIVNKIGEETGLDKPVREVKEEVILLLTHPKKSVEKTLNKVGKAGQVIINKLPWR